MPGVIPVRSSHLGNPPRFKVKYIFLGVLSLWMVLLLWFVFSGTGEMKPDLVHARFTRHSKTLQSAWVPGGACHQAWAKVLGNLSLNTGMRHSLEETAWSVWKRVIEQAPKNTPVFDLTPKAIEHGFRQTLESMWEKSSMNAKFEYSNSNLNSISAYGFDPHCFDPRGFVTNPTTTTLASVMEEIQALVDHENHVHGELMSVVDDLGCEWLYDKSDNNNNNNKNNNNNNNRISKSCAVVGSSDTLTYIAADAMISRAEMVIRANHGPTGNHVAGNHTTVRLINGVVLEKWLDKHDPDFSHLDAEIFGKKVLFLVASPKEALYARVVAELGKGAKLRKVHTPHEAANRVKRKILLGESVEYQDFRAVIAKHTNAIAKHTNANAKHTTANAKHTNAKHTHANAKHTHANPTPSTGLAAVIMTLATGQCGFPVGLYGMDGLSAHEHCCTNPHLMYSFFEGSKTKWKCCAQGREDTRPESALYTWLDHMGVVAWPRLINPDLIDDGDN